MRAAHGTRERVDALILATGHRPDLGYLGLAGRPAHRGGVSTDLRGLGFVELERQRSFASATLRGVARDGAYVLKSLVQQQLGRQTVR